MEDRELLELAAKAAGFVLADEVDAYIPSGGLWTVGPGGRDTVWNPLNDDGDALRLAVKLDLSIYRPGSDPAARSWTDSEIIFHEAVCVRRAIVTAAAAMGKVMQEQH